MPQANPKLDRFIADLAVGDADPLTDDEEAAEANIWSGRIAEIDERTYQFYMRDNAGPPKMMQDDWFVFSDARSVETPGILFWQRGDQYFARRLDQEEWDKLLKVAKVKKKFW